jgi:hypothetical protein
MLRWMKFYGMILIFSLKTRTVRKEASALEIHLLRKLDAALKRIWKKEAALLTNKPTSRLCLPSDKSSASSEQCGSRDPRSEKIVRIKISPEIERDDLIKAFK